MISLHKYFLIFLMIKIIKCELYTSYNDMATLVKTQMHVTHILSKYLDNQFEKLKKAKLILEEFQQMANVTNGNPNNFIENPVNSFLLVKVLTKKFEMFIAEVNVMDELNKMLNHIDQNYLMPTDEDYKGVATALFRLGDTYLLEPQEIRLGNLSSKYPSRPLNELECYDLGLIAYEQNDYYNSVGWMKQAFFLANFTSNKSRQLNLSSVEYYITMGSAHHLISLGDYKSALLILNDFIMRNQNNTEAIHLKLKIEGDDYFLRDKLTYESLCRGEIKEKSRNKKREQNLTCHYINYNPLIKIAPIKVEIVNLDPLILLYHEIISDQQIEIMKNLSSNKLERSRVKGSNQTGDLVDYRISKSGWIDDVEHPTLDYLSGLISSITNLSMETAETWQIANYGVGGQYEPHFDFGREELAEETFDCSIGNRIATFLFYLEVPEKGGSTVFPKINIEIKPIRRSAVFWYNLLPNGIGDRRTLHAGCPVLFGTKWISNRWIHAVSQEFRRPCNLFND